MEGAVIAVREKWNHSYYGEGTTPEDILVGHKVQVAGADKLRRAVANAAR